MGSGCRTAARRFFNNSTAESNQGAPVVAGSGHPLAGLMKSRAIRLDFAMLHPVRFVARPCVDPALKGPDTKAQGNALGIDDELCESALKGRNRICCAYGTYS